MSDGFVIQNKKARHDYEILEEYDAGVVLLGTEVKSLRNHKGSLVGAFVKIIGNEAFLYGMHIPEYDQGNIYNHDPLRERKLLLHRREIKKLAGATSQKGLALVALSLRFVRSYVKIRIALARGKKLYDKRETIKKKTQDREIARAVRKRVN